MASSEKHDKDAGLSWRQLYLHGLGVSVRGNAQAFGFSILITVTYGIVSASSKTPAPFELVGFALSAVAAFSLLNVLITWLKSTRTDDPEYSVVLLVATATDFLAVGAGVGVAFAITAMSDGWVQWILTPFLVGIVYSLVQALEISLARKGTDSDD